MLKGFQHNKIYNTLKNPICGFFEFVYAMNISNLITENEHYQGNEKKLFAAIALRVLNESSIFSLLEHAELLKTNLQTLLEEKESPSGPFSKKTSLDNYTSSLQTYALKQRQILSCPHDDEHVVLLACLKALEDLGAPSDYKIILKEILVKNLHKVVMPKENMIFTGRTKEKDEIIRTLSRSSRNSVLIIGQGGIGKTTLAKAILNEINNGNVYQLFSGNADFYDQVVTLQAGNKGKPVLFFLDELFSFEAAQIKYLVENAQFIATANESSYKKFATDQPSIVSKFETVTLEEPEKNDLEHILQIHMDHVAHVRSVTFESGVLAEVMTLSKQYMPDSSFPQKGIAVFEEAALLSLSQDNNFVSKETIRAIISQKTNIPVDSLTELNKKDLSELPDRLGKRVKGQDEAIEKVSKVIQRSKLGFGKKNRPIGSFLFVGPSGVGKTELAKAVAREMFGDADNMVRLDMSEFSEAHNVQRLIGAPPGYIGFEEGGQLTNPIKAKPYNLILLDEIEKAHPRVFDIFLQVLDDGRLTDGQGKVVDFRNTIIIATSNAGIEDILDLIEEGKETDEITKEVKEILTDYFRIEFINRFDDVVIFNALKPDALFEIGRLQIEKLKHELAKREIGFSVSDETLQYVAKESYDPRYGARGLLRYIQEKIENQLAEMIINNQIQKGQTIEF